MIIDGFNKSFNTKFFKFKNHLNSFGSESLVFSIVSDLIKYCFFITYETARQFYL